MDGRAKTLLYVGQQQEDVREKNKKEFVSHGFEKMLNNKLIILMVQW